MVRNRVTPATSGAQSLRVNNIHAQAYFHRESFTFISTTVLSYDLVTSFFLAGGLQTLDVYQMRCDDQQVA